MYLLDAVRQAQGGPRTISTAMAGDAATVTGITSQVYPVVTYPSSGTVIISGRTMSRHTGCGTISA